jgi:tRNA-dihydrouridine synthase 1
MTPSSSKSLLAYTPMLHARMFNETAKFRDNHFQPLRTSLLSNVPSSVFQPSDLYLDGNPSLDRPLTVQFCANDPDELLGAAKHVAPFCDAVDLNLGCPQGIARKGRYGAFLQEDQQLIFDLINKLHNELDVPVTAKIRILETKEKTLEYARNVLKAGASILTVHGRHRDQKGHKTGLADWKMIRYLREQLGEEVVLFANGNILRREDIDRCLEETGADGVMSAEGNLYDPAIFAEDPAVGEEGREYWRGRDGKGGWRMDAVLRRYMDILYKYVLEVPAPERRPLYLPSDPEVAVE